MPKSNTNTSVNIMALCLACSVLAGCGTKGPLYMPEQRYPQKATQPAPQAVPETPASQPAN